MPYEEEVEVTEQLAVEEDIDVEIKVPIEEDVVIPDPPCHWHSK